MPFEWCTVDDCENEAASGGICWAHIKQRSRTGKVGEVQKRPKSPFERLTEASLEYADADAALEYGADLDEEEVLNRAKDNLRKSAAAYAKVHVGEMAREALLRAKARGVRIGRPPKLSQEDAAAAVASAGSIKRAAAALGVTRRTVRRALGGSKGAF